MKKRFNNLRIGIVLSSGGGRGVFAHTGFMQAINELGIVPAAISGCSAGALVGGVLASGTPLEKWIGALKNIETSHYWQPDGWLEVLWNMFARKGQGYTGIADTGNAVEFIRSNLTVSTFEQCTVPFSLRAFNLSRGLPSLLSSGELATAIMASAAIPVLYRPVNIDGELYCDGAIVELASTDAVCCEHQLDLLIVHHACVHRNADENIKQVMTNNWTMLEILNTLLYYKRPWYLSEQPITLNKCRCGCGASIVSIEPSLPELQWPLFQGGTLLQNSAREQAIELLAPFIDKLTAKKAKTINMESPTTLI